MSHPLLLLGHSRESGMALARRLIALGYHPAADAWATFAPRAYRKRDRPLAVLADADHPDAPPMEAFIPVMRASWGEDIPFLAVTSSKRFRRHEALLEAGFADCLPPDINEALLNKKLLRALAVPAEALAPSADEDLPASLAGIFFGRSNLVRLADIAEIYPGAVPRSPRNRRLAPPDSSWRGVVTANSLHRFGGGKASEYLLWTRMHLFRLPDPAEYAVAEKVLLSRSGPPLTAAVDRSRLPAGGDVYSIIPREGAGAGFIACVLNSRLLDFYFNRLAGAEDGRLRLEAVRETPFPRPNPETVRDFGRLASLLAHYGPNPRDWIDRQSRDEAGERMDGMVFGCYGAGDAVREELAAMHF